MHLLAVAPTLRSRSRPPSTCRACRPCSRCPGTAAFFCGFGRVVVQPADPLSRHRQVGVIARRNRNLLNARGDAVEIDFHLRFPRASSPVALLSPRFGFRRLRGICRGLRRILRSCPGCSSSAARTASAAPSSAPACRSCPSGRSTDRAGAIPTAPPPSISAPGRRRNKSTFRRHSRTAESLLYRSVVIGVKAASPRCTAESAKSCSAIPRAKAIQRLSGDQRTFSNCGPELH